MSTVNEFLMQLEKETVRVSLVRPRHAHTTIYLDWLGAKRRHALRFARLYPLLCAA